MSLNIKIKPLILVGCSGSGRSAIIFNLTRNLPHKFQRLVSHTTRPKRPSQQNNRDFYFVQQPWMKQNLSKFVTLTYSGNGNYYGLTSQQISRIKSKNKIPIFRMTLDAYVANTTKSNPQQNTNEQLKKSQFENKGNVQKLQHEVKLQNCVSLVKQKNIMCNALYITVPSISQLTRRLKYTPLTPKEQTQKIQKAKKQHRQASKYFADQDIIGKYHDLDQGQGDEPFQQNLIRIKSRLFQLY